MKNPWRHIKLTKRRVVLSILLPTQLVCFLTRKEQIFKSVFISIHKCQCVNRACTLPMVLPKTFFAEPACHYLELDGFNKLLSFWALSPLSKQCALSINSATLEINTLVPRVKPGTAGCKVQMLPLCYAGPQLLPRTTKWNLEMIASN